MKLHDIIWTYQVGALGAGAIGSCGELLQIFQIYLHRNDHFLLLLFCYCYESESLLHLLWINCVFGLNLLFLSMVMYYEFKDKRMPPWFKPN